MPQPPDPYSPQASQAAFPTNSSIVTLPTETVLEILSYYPQITDDDVLTNLDEHITFHCLSKTFRASLNVIRALSQTCRRLRWVCLPMAWNRLELCTEDFINIQRQAPMAESLLRQLRPARYVACGHLFTHIRTITVSIPTHRSEETLPNLATLFGTLPNLYRIEIFYLATTNAKSLKANFAGKCFPTVRSITMPCHAHDILQCCPNVETVICNSPKSSHFINTMVQANCNNIKELRYIRTSEVLCRRLYKIARLTLKSIHVISENPSDEVIAEYAKFKALRFISVRLKGKYYKDGEEEAHAQAMIIKAKALLEGNQYDGLERKRIEIVYTPKRDTEQWELLPSKVVSVSIH